MKLIKILSLNVRGLRNHVKRRALFLYLKNQKADFYCLQETFSLKEDEVPWASEWGGKILFSHGTKHSKGTGILQRPNSLFPIECLSTDPNGRFVIAKIKLGDEVFLASVYTPCDSQQQSLFIQNLCTDIVSKTNTSRIIIAGEFILWNNRDINIENKSVFWKAWRDKIVTNKELKRFGITDCDKCVMCGENDSIEHTFFECQSFLKLSDESLQWFNSLNKINVSLISLQYFLNLPTSTANLSDKQTKDLCLLLLYAKQYHYACKIMRKKPDSSELISKFIIQLEIEI